MAQQVNILPMGLAQRQQQAVTADITLDQFDTGKVLIVSSSAPITVGGGLTCSLPSASAVEPGFFCTIILDSNHSHSVRRIGDTVDAIGLTGGGGAFIALGQVGDFGIAAVSNDSARGSSVGSSVEIYCDGQRWTLEAAGGADWTTLF
jgi:hypothetical protein